MQRFVPLILAILVLTACTQQELQPAQATAEAVIHQVAPTAKAAIEQVAPTIRALVPTPDSRYPSMLNTAIIACFAPRCAAEDALILAAGTRYRDTGQDDGTWRFIEVQGGGQVWVPHAKLTG
jgi:hypothetical protein